MEGPSGTAVLRTAPERGTCQAEKLGLIVTVRNVTVKLILQVG